MGVDGLSKTDIGNMVGAEMLKTPHRKNSQPAEAGDKVNMDLASRYRFHRPDDLSGELDHMLFDDNGEVDIKKLNKTTELINRMLKASYRRLDISVHEKTKKIMVKIIDTESNELIREVPPEKTLDILANMWELAGILLDTTG